MIHESYEVRDQESNKLGRMFTQLGISKPHPKRRLFPHEVDTRKCNAHTNIALTRPGIPIQCPRNDAAKVSTVPIVATDQPTQPLPYPFPISTTAWTGDRGEFWA